MKPSFKVLSGTITSPQGFRAAGVFCDIKRLGTGKGSEKGAKRDLGLIVSDIPAQVAGLFTTNQVCAAPVKVSLPRAQQPIAQAIVVNSGNANACTGAIGMRDAETMTRLTAESLHIPTKSVLVCSTGRIGVPLPMPNVKRGITAAARLLSDSQESGHQVMEAIMTSDTRPKEYALELVLGGKTVRIAGICKGAGMIQPGMSVDGKRPPAMPLHATLLGFITTDVAIDSDALKGALEQAVANSFNRITVDGDMSTNDSIIALANGLAGNPRMTRANRSSPDWIRFQMALNQVTLELAKMIVRDGEGVSRFVTVKVSGAATFTDADLVARSVANSALVKTSWCGGDPNWGRILDAMGYSLARVVESRVDVGYSAPGSSKVIYSLKRGQPTKVKFEALCARVAAREFDLHIHLNLGTAHAVLYAADLTEAYVDFNKGNVSDPASLGG